MSIRQYTGRGFDLELNNNMLSIRIVAHLKNETEDQKVFEKDNIVAGRYQVIERKRGVKKPTGDLSRYSDEIRNIVASTTYKTLTEKIRDLAKHNLERTEIRDLLGIRYQQVRQALVNKKK